MSLNSISTDHPQDRVRSSISAPGCPDQVCQGAVQLRRYRPARSPARKPERGAGLCHQASLGQRQGRRQRSLGRHLGRRRPHQRS